MGYILDGEEVDGFGMTENQEDLLTEYQEDPYLLWSRYILSEPGSGSTRYYRDLLGDEIASLNAESALIETLCKKTGIRLMLKTLGPDSWELALA